MFILVLYSDEFKSNFTPGERKQVKIMSEDIKQLEIRARNLLKLMDRQLRYLDVVIDLSKSKKIDVEWQLSVDQRLLTLQYDMISLSKEINS